MRRREFITLLGGAAAWPITAGAEQPALPVIGLLDPRSPDELAHRLRGFRRKPVRSMCPSRSSLTSPEVREAPKRTCCRGVSMVN